jgi:hypothetical protein
MHRHSPIAQPQLVAIQIEDQIEVGAVGERGEVA